MMQLKLTERGPPKMVSLEMWRSASLEEPMKMLAARKVVRLTRTAAGVMVTPGNHVGEMILPSAEISILPKSPRLLRAMDELSLRANEKIANNFNLESQKIESDEIDPAGSFVKALLECIHEGVPWEYASRTSVTSFPRGRIDFGSTVRRLAARGIQHRVVATIPIHMQERDFVRVVRAALDIIPSVRGATPKSLAEAETLSAALDGAEPFRSIQDALDAATALSQRIDHEISPAAAALAARSAEILSSEHATGGWVKHVPGGIARFRNLEALWEKCTQQLVATWILSEGLNGHAILHGLRKSGIRLFYDGGPELDPDVIVRDRSAIIAIFDAKYKLIDIGSVSSASDQYQLTCYVRRLSANAGMLVHLSESKDHLTHVGTTLEGAPILTAAISEDLLLEFGENALLALLGRWSRQSEGFKQRFSYSFSQDRGDGVADLSSDVFLGA